MKKQTLDYLVFVDFSVLNGFLFKLNLQIHRSKIPEKVYETKQSKEIQNSWAGQEKFSRLF